MSEDLVSDSFVNKWFRFKDKWYKDQLNDYYNTPEEQRHLAQLYTLNLKDVIEELEPKNTAEKTYCENALASFIALNSIHWSNKEVPIIVRADEINKELISEKRDYYINNPHFIVKPPNNKSGCFIATATFENVNAPEVIFLRKWRNETLLKSLFGQYFIKVYYIISPSISFIISKNRILRKISKSILLRIIKSLKN